MDAPAWKKYLRKPENALQWLWTLASFSAPIAGFLAGSGAAAKDGSPVLIVPHEGFMVVLLAMGGSVAAGLSLSLAGFFRRPPWAFPAVAFGAPLFLVRLWVALRLGA